MRSSGETLDGWVLVFNYVALTLVHALRAVDCTQEDGQGGVSVIGLRWSVVGSQVHLYSADRQGKVKAWNALNGQLVATYQGHRDGLLDLDLVPRAAAAVPAVDQLLAAADSNDATVKLYRIPFHEPSTTASTCSNIRQSSSRWFVLCAQLPLLSCPW